MPDTICPPAGLSARRGRVQHRPKAEAKAKIRDEDVAGERGATKEELLGVKRLLNLNKATEAETRAKEKLVKTTGDVNRNFSIAEKAVAAEAAGLIRFTGLFGPAAAGGVAVAAAVGARQEYMEGAKRGAELANPAVAFQARRAELNLEATENKFKIPALQKQTENDRVRAAAFEQAQKEGGFTAWRMRAEQTLGLRKFNRFFEEALGVGPDSLERKLADKNPKGGVQAIDSRLGQFFSSGDDLYRAFASHALATTPVDDKRDPNQKEQVPWKPSPIYDPTKETWGEFRRRQDAAFLGEKVADHFWKDTLN